MYMVRAGRWLSAMLDLMRKVSMLLGEVKKRARNQY